MTTRTDRPVLTTAAMRRMVDRFGIAWVIANVRPDMTADERARFVNVAREFWT